MKTALTTETVLYEDNCFQTNAFVWQATISFQAHTEHVPYFPGKHWFPKSISHEFAHHKF